MKKKIYSTVYLFAANMLSIAVAVACIPLLAAMYTPEQFGKWSVAISLSGFLAIVATLQLEQFIPACRYRFEALLLASGTRNLLIVSCLVLVAAGLLLSTMVGSMNWAKMTLVCGMLILAIGLNQILQYVLTRKTSYHALANRQFFLVAGKALLQMLFSLRPAALLINGLVAGELTARVAQLLVSDRQSLHTVILGSRRRLPWLYCFRRHWVAKGLHITISRLLSDGGLLLMPVLVTFLYGTNAAGQFSIAFTAVLSIINAVLMTANSILMGEAAHHYRDDRARFRRHVWRALSLMCVAGIAMYLFSIAFARPVIDLLFHEGWSRVYHYFMMLLPAHCVALAFGLTGTVLTLMHKPQHALYASLLWHAILWPSAIYCFVISTRMDTFLFWLNISIAARYLLNLACVIYWLRK